MPEPDKCIDKTGFLQDFILQLRLRLKLLMRDKFTVIAFLIATIIFALVLNTLNLWAENNSSIPVGIVNEDSSEFSERLLDNLLKVPSISVNQGSFEEMESMLLDGNISCIFIIRDGYGERIKNGNIDEAIGLYSGRDDKTAAILGDIVAGQMMYDICLYKSMDMYMELAEGNLSEAEYKTEFDKIMSSPDIDFDFQISYIDIDNLEEETEKIDNSLLYRQMIAGMVAMLLSFVILFAYSQTVVEHEQGIYNRRRVTIQSLMAGRVGNITAVLLISMILCILIAVSTASSVVNSASGAGSGGFGSIFFGILLISVVYIIVLSIVMTILSNLTRTIAQYQMIGGVLLLLAGVAGFASVFSGFMGETLQKILGFVPNSLYIKFFTDIIM